MRTPHIVALSRQSLEVLAKLRAISFGNQLVFPGDVNPLKPMSNNALLFALYRMGYRGRMTGHGFRGVASTILHERGWPHAHIELQLAHQERDSVSASYNHATAMHACPSGLEGTGRDGRRTRTRTFTRIHVCGGRIPELRRRGRSRCRANSSRAAGRRARMPPPARDPHPDGDARPAGVSCARPHHAEEVLSVAAGAPAAVPCAVQHEPTPGRRAAERGAYAIRPDA
jgi:hypothetical protein